MQFKENTFKAFVLTSIAYLFGYISNFLILYFLSQIFPPEEFVYYPFSLTFLLFFLIFADFGIGTTIIRALSSSKEEGQDKLERMILEGFRIILVFTTISSIILFFLSDWIEQIYSMKGLSIILKYTSLYLFSTNLIYYFESCFLGLWNFKLYAISNITLNFLKLIFILMNFYYEMQISTIILLFSILAAGQLTLILILIQIKYKILRIFINFNRRISIDILRFSSFVFLPLIFQFIISQFNQFILAYYISPTELAYYLIAVKIILLLSMPIFIIYRVVFSYVSNFFEKKELEKIRLIYNAIFKYGFLIMIPIFLYVIYFSEYLIILLFGPAYYPAAIYLKIYSIYLIFKLMDLTGESFLLASNEPKLVLKLSGITALFTIILSLILIPNYNIYGAIFSILVPYSTYIIYSNYLVKKKNNITINRKGLTSVFKYFLASIISLFIIFLIITFLNFKPEVIITLITFTATYISLFFILAVIFKAISISEFKQIINILKSIF